MNSCHEYPRIKIEVFVEPSSCWDCTGDAPAETPGNMELRKWVCSATNNQDCIHQIWWFYMGISGRSCDLIEAMESQHFQWVHHLEFGWFLIAEGSNRSSLGHDHVDIPLEIRMNKWALWGPTKTMPHSCGGQNPKDIGLEAWHCGVSGLNSTANWSGRKTWTLLGLVPSNIEHPKNISKTVV